MFFFEGSCSRRNITHLFALLLLASYGLSFTIQGFEFFPVNRSLDATSGFAERRSLRETNANNQSVMMPKASQESLKQLVMGLDNSQSSNLHSLKQTIMQMSGNVVSTIAENGVVTAVVVNVAEKKVSELIASVKAESLVSYVEPRIKMKATFGPDDPQFSEQWGLSRIQAEWAWNTTTGKKEILVAVVDSGIDYEHPDLASNYVPCGYDWVNGDNDPMDDLGHGTHCAGTIAAQINNGLGIAGIAQVGIMAEKVLDSIGEGFSDWIAAGIKHAVNQGAKVISISLGGIESSQLVHEAIQYADAAGVLIVAAAGNDASSRLFYPASFEEVVAVAATDYSDIKAQFSNFGNWIDLAAPGVNILSTFPNKDYRTYSGTSMACPFVSGLAALILSTFPNQTADFANFLLRYSADDLGEPGFDPLYGYGRINAKTAIYSPPTEHELAVFRLTTPPYLEVNSNNVVTASVFNLGRVAENNVTVKLLANGTEIWGQTLGSLGSYSTAFLSAPVHPILEGFYNITLYVSQVVGEVETDNNYLQKLVYAGTPVKALVLRSDYSPEAITTWDTLNTGWQLLGARMIYVDYVSMRNTEATYQKLNESKADVLIFSNIRTYEFTDDEIDAITHYVHDGHGLIITGNTFSDEVPNNKRLAGLVGLTTDISLDWYFNRTDLLQILTPSNRIFVDIPDPIILPLVATTIPRALVQQGWSNSVLSGAEYLAMGSFNESAILEFNGLFYVSPMLESILPQYHHHLQLLYNMITCSTYQKPLHDIELSLNCPRWLMPNEIGFMEATIYNTGTSDETDVRFSLGIDGVVVNETVIPELRSGLSTSVTFSLGTTSEEIHEVTAVADLLPNENNSDNNEISRTLFVHYPRFVLWDYFHGDPDGQAREEYQLLIEQMKREGFIIDESGNTMIDTELLNKYDLLVEIGSEEPFSQTEISDILNWIDSGGSALLCVDNGYDSSLRLLTLPYGVQLFREQLGWGFTRNLASHPVTRGVNQIFFTSPTHLEINPPSQTLAWTTQDLRTFNFVSMLDDKIVIVGDEHMLDNSHMPRVDNKCFILNLFHWLAKRRVLESDLAITLQAPPFVQKGEVPILNVTVRNRGSIDANDIQAFMCIDDSIVESIQIPYLPSGGLYTFNPSWRPDTSRDFQLVARVAIKPQENQTDNNEASMIVPVVFYKMYRFPNHWHASSAQDFWHATEGCWTYTLPFEFLFYNHRYETIFISSRGLITFTDPDDFGPATMNSLGNKLAIAPAWSEWLLSDSYGVYVENVSSTSIRITWEVYDMAGTVASFAAELCKDGAMRFYYGYSNQEVYAIYGISNGKGHMLIQRVSNLNHFDTFVFTPFEIVHEIGISLQAPTIARVGETIILNVTVSNTGEFNESSLTTELLVNGSSVMATIISELISGTTRAFNYSLVVYEKGQLNITASVAPIQFETYNGNNVVTRFMNVLSNNRTRLLLNPGNMTVGPSMNFTLNVEVEGVENMYAWQVALVFDPEVLNCLEVSFPSDNVFAYSLPLFPPPMIQEGYVLIGGTLLGSTRSFTGVGKLCQITLGTVAEGNSTIRIQANDTFLLDQFLAVIDCDFNDGFVKVQKGDFNKDGTVDLSDLAIMTQAFAIRLGEPGWNSMLDLNNDSRIDMRDIGLEARQVEF